MTENKISHLVHFFQIDLWDHSYKPKNGFETWLYKILRVTIQTVNGFNRDECYLKASSLTFYSLLSIVPVLAVAFGFAKGFGFASILEKQVQEQLHDQPELASKIINFSYSALSHAEGGLIAGIGILALLWTVIKLLESVETSLNDIWKIPTSRSFIRKLSDYLAIMIVSPISLVISSSLTIYISTQLLKATQQIEILSAFTSWLLHFLPYILIWALFSFIYLIMPNTKIPMKYAILAGIIAGTAYQIVQWAYIRFQVGVGSYGAIYGSFAAIPLFLIWVNISWQIVMLGAEIAYHAEQESYDYGFAGHGKARTLVSKKILGLLTVGYCIQDFHLGLSPTTLTALSSAVGVSKRTVRQVIEELVDANVLSEVKSSTDSECYQPARDIDSITLKYVIDALDQTQRAKISTYMTQELFHLQQALELFEKGSKAITSNVLLKNSFISHP